MKVLVISHMYPSTFNNVYGIFVHKQVKALIELGCEVKVISPVPLSFFPLTVIKKKWKEYADIPKRAIIEGVEVFYPRYAEIPNSFMFGYLGYSMYLGIRNAVKSLYRDYKFDIIHSHVALPDGFAAMLLNKDYEVPHVVSIHGQDFQSTINKNSVSKENLFKALRGSNKIITVSNKLKNVVKSEDFIQKVIVVNNGIDIDDIKEYDGNKGTQKILLSVSSLIETKGVDLNIKALSILAKKYSDLKYLIIGEGPEREKLINLVNELGLASNVEFLGRLSHDKVMEYMAKADVFSMPSWEEGFGVVYVEAMASGTPTIGVWGEGIEDVIRDGENGFLVEPHSVDGIVKAVDLLLSNEDHAKKIGRAAKATVIENFTWLKNGVKTLDVYKRMLNKN